MGRYADVVSNHTDIDKVLIEYIQFKFDAIVDLVSALDDDTANQTLNVSGSNSPIQILVHCCGMLRRWSSTVNLDQPIPRDRAREFEAHMPVHQALALARSVRKSFVLDAAATDLKAQPLAVPEGRECFWTSTCEGVLLHVFEELCQHLGHLEITIDALRAPHD